MTILEGILAAIVAIAGILKLADKWFTKSATEKVEDRKEAIEGELDEFKKLRPRK